MERLSRTIAVGAGLVIVVVAGWLGYELVVINQMHVAELVLLELVIVGPPLLLTVGLFGTYRTIYLERWPDKYAYVTWSRYTPQLSVFAVMMVVACASLVHYDVVASKYFATNTTSDVNILPSLVIGRGSLPMAFSMGRESAVTRLPTILLWWAFVGALVNISGSLLRRYLIGHLVARSYLNVTFRLVYAFVASALFFLAAQAWPELLGTAGAGGNNRHLLMLASFFAGMFPTEIIRLVVNRIRGLLKLEVRRQLPLSEIRGIDDEMVQFMQDEGVWSVADLAARDPRDLAEAIHLDLDLVTQWVNEARLLNALGDVALAAHFRTLGINEWHDLQLLEHLDLDTLTADMLTKKPDDDGAVSPVVLHSLRERYRAYSAKHGAAVQKKGAA